MLVSCLYDIPLAIANKAMLDLIGTVLMNDQLIPWPQREPREQFVGPQLQHQTGDNALLLADFLLCGGQRQSCHLLLLPSSLPGCRPAGA